MPQDETQRKKWLTMLARLPDARRLEFWQELNPHLTISQDPFRLTAPATSPDNPTLREYQDRMHEEGYFQSAPTLPSDLRDRMLGAIESVRQQGLPPMFAFVYDIFYQGLSYFDPIFSAILGSGYRLVPNMWIYYVEPADEAKGFAPHRDAEYLNALTDQGMPTVMTVWITVTEATPLNSCLYVVPKNRDPEYVLAINDLSRMANAFTWEDVRALPTEPGVMSCWTQYLFHWGSRSSRRATQPRVTYAVYLQRGDIEPLEKQTVAVPAPMDFPRRLSMICQSLHHYTYSHFKEWTRADEMMAFLDQHIQT